MKNVVARIMKRIKNARLDLNNGRIQYLSHEILPGIFTYIFVSLTFLTWFVG